jgi:hypothetical protein
VHAAVEQHGARAAFCREAFDFAAVDVGAPSWRPGVVDDEGSCPFWQVRAVVARPRRFTEELGRRRRIAARHEPGRQRVHERWRSAPWMRNGLDGRRQRIDWRRLA